MSTKELIVTTVIPKDRWQDVKVIAVDIETDTEDPLGKKDGSGSYGKSYVADITDVALLDVAGNRGLVFQHPTKKEQKFIADLLSRDYLTIIAHNAVFDLRSLGGHYGFQIARHSLVWDTLTIGVRMLMGDKQGRGFALLSVAARLEVTFPYSIDFLEEMKSHRKDLSGLPTAMLTMAPNNPIWDEVGGYIPPKTKTSTGEHPLFKAAAKQAVAKYVLSDTILAAEIYKKQLDTAVKLDKEHVKIGAWYHVPVWKALKVSLDWWLRGLRVAANQAITGVRMDVDYVKRLIDDYEKIIKESSDSALQVKDNSDPYPSFNEVISTLYYFYRVLEVCKDSANKYSNPKGWKFWKHIKLSKQVLKEAISWPELSEEQKEEWLSFLLELDPIKITRGKLLKAAPKTLSPVINLEGYIEETCFKDVPGAKFLAKTKTKWWVSYYTATKSDNPSTIRMLNKKSFKPYYLFVISKIPTPSTELLEEFPRLLLTKKGFAIAKGSLDRGEPVLAEPLMMNDFLSFGKEAITIYRTSLEKDDPRVENVSIYHQFLEATAKYSMLKELLLHSRRDGRIHSIIVPATRTGRDTSSSPNLQNLNMDILRGVLIGDPGFVLVELDLSNAENVMAAMVAGDDSMAATTEEGDFHSKMAAIYFAKEWKEADVKRRKELRSLGKTFTFGTAYGMGTVSMQLGLREEGTYMALDVIRKIIASKDKAYAKVMAKKREIIKDSKARYAAGFRPAYSPLWSGERVQVPHPDEGYDDGPEYRKTWNYAVQGGVATPVHRSMVEAQEWFEDEGYQTRIAIDVHDSHINHCEEKEADIVLPKNAEFMGTQIPENFLRRTVPMTHFVSSAGPENAKKWGYVNGKEYSLPLNKFYNQWGVHDMPEGETEAPIWRGPLDKGWTLAKETAAIKKGMTFDESLQGQAGLSSSEEVEEDEELPTFGHLRQALKKLSQIEKGYDLTLPQSNGTAPTQIKISYADIGTTLQTLTMKGHDLSVTTVVEQLQETVTLLALGAQALLNKKKELENIYAQLPNEQKPLDPDVARTSSGDEKQESSG